MLFLTLSLWEWAKGRSSLGGQWQTIQRPLIIFNNIARARRAVDRAVDHDAVDRAVDAVDPSGMRAVDAVDRAVDAVDPSGMRAADAARGQVGDGCSDARINRNRDG